MPWLPTIKDIVCWMKPYFPITSPIVTLMKNVYARMSFGFWQGWVLAVKELIRWLKITWLIAQWVPCSQYWRSLLILFTNSLRILCTNLFQRLISRTSSREVSSRANSKLKERQFLSVTIYCSKARILFPL